MAKSPVYKRRLQLQYANSKKAKEILASPVNNTIYFAGEAISRSESQGMVESAFQSGYDAAKLLIGHYQ